MLKKFPYSPMIKTRKVNIIKNFCNKFKAVWFIIFSTDSHCWKDYVLNGIVWTFHSCKDRIGTPFYKFIKIFKHFKTFFLKISVWEHQVSARVWFVEHLLLFRGFFVKNKTEKSILLNKEISFTIHAFFYANSSTGDGCSNNKKPDKLKEQSLFDVTYISHSLYTCFWAKLDKFVFQ